MRLCGNLTISSVVAILLVRKLTRNSPAMVKTELHGHGLDFTIEDGTYHNHDELSQLRLA